MQMECWLLPGPAWIVAATWRVSQQMKDCSVSPFSLQLFQIKERALYNFLKSSQIHFVACIFVLNSVKSKKYHLLNQETQSWSQHFDALADGATDTEFRSTGESAVWGRFTGQNDTYTWAFTQHSLGDHLLTRYARPQSGSEYKWGPLLWTLFSVHFV